MTKHGFEPAQPEQQVAQATQADEDALVQRAGYGGIVRSSELDELGPERAHSAMNRIIRQEKNPSQATFTGRRQERPEMNSMLRGLLARRDTRRATGYSNYGGDPSPEIRQAGETPAAYQQRRDEHRRKNGG